MTGPGGDADALLGARSARLYYAYAAAVDAGDLDRVRSLVTDDIRTTVNQRPVQEGMEAFLDVYRAHNALQLPLCRHVVTNVVAHQDAPGPDIVTRAYFQAYLFQDDVTTLLIGAYDDVHRDVDGELRIAHKVVTVHRRLLLPASSAG